MEYNKKLKLRLLWNHLYDSKQIFGTIMILSFQTDMPRQTVQTQIRLLQVQILEWLQQIFWVFEYLGNL